MREIALDSETTGQAHAQGHRIVSLGVVELIDGKITGREREWFFNPDRPCDRGAFDVHGLPDWWLAKQSRFYVYRRDIEDFIGDDRIIAHNAPFDRGFLNMEMGRALKMASLTEAEANRFPKGQWRDSLPIARRAFPQQPNNLDALADRFGIDRAHRKKHGALKDARILAEIYIELLRGGQGSLFEHMAEPEQQTRWEPPPFDRAARIPAPSRLTSAEIERWQSVWGNTVGKTGVWAEYINGED